MAEAATQTKPTKAPPISVTMADGSGRVVEFGQKQRLKKESRVDAERVYVILDFVNGQSRTFSALHYIPAEALSTTTGKLAAKAQCHGYEQKLGDEISGVDDLDDAIEAIDQLIARLNTGYDGWTQKAEAGSMAGASILAKAIAEATGQSIEVVRPALAAMKPNERAALKLDASIAPIVKRLEDEKAARAAAAGKGKAAVDTAGLLARIGKPAQNSAFDNGGNSGSAAEGEGAPPV